MKGKTLYTLIGVCLLTLVWAMPSSGEMSSPSYKVRAQVLDGGGSKSSSPNFSVTGAIGQSTPVGLSQSANFQNSAGFIPQVSRPRGDLNGDGAVNILDLTLCINCILEAESCEWADVNNDGFVNILDMYTIINIILAG